MTRLKREQRYCFLIAIYGDQYPGQQSTHREVYAAYDYCDALYQINKDMNASYYPSEWEIIKEWRMK